MCCQVTITNQDESQWLVASARPTEKERPIKERTVEILYFAMNTTSFEVRLAIGVNARRGSHAWWANRTGQGSAEIFFRYGPPSPRERFSFRSSLTVRHACPIGWRTPPPSQIRSYMPDLRFDDLHYKVVDGAVHFLEPVGNSRWYYDNVAL
jgi:hypothetical protein